MVSLLFLASLHFLMLLASSTPTRGEAPSSPTLTDDDYAVYSVVCSSRPLADPNQLLVIQDETSITDWAAHRADTSMVQTAGFGTALEDQRLKFDQPGVLEPRLKLSNKYQIVKKSSLDAFIRDPSGLSGGWEGFRKMFPEATGFVELSRIGFDASHDKAVLYVVHHCHPAHCTSQGYYVVVDKFEGRWRLFGFLGGRIGQSAPR